MSTLTSSPSPAASPRSSFHVQRSSYSSHSFSAPSPKQRGFNASPVQRASGSTGGSKQPRAHYSESPAIEKKPHTYVNQGTQYSPDGYPPTAGDQPDRKTDREGAPSSATKKRKEPPSLSAPDPMSTSAASSASSIPSRPPTEPEPRLDPTPAPSFSTTASSASAHPPAGQHAETQEARSTHGHSSTPKRSRTDSAPATVMPVLYQNCNPKALGVLVSNMLMELIRLNDQIPLRDGRLTRFHSRAPPGIIYYIDLLCQKYSNFTINSLTVHRFLITAATVAAKGLSDSFWTNPTYAKIGGIPVSELATLELEFLHKVEWKIVPKPEVLEEYYRSLIERTEGFELEQTGSSSSSLLEDSEEDNTDGDEIMADEPT
ncbi:Pho80p cyclin [Saxophila tyrrhenica]|uniref:Pho80p cyclin n=1 Tax=Saxophila tyrrhenica TaxID=1690608 RepID=A0AAV9PGT8_9PEZI|nr:Pho80p cyclin [Saxophila tyrrhenica]